VATIKQGLDIRMDQKLVMTPQLQLAIKLLQMPVLDLQEFINQEIMDNPFLGDDDGMGEENASSGEKESSGEEMDSLSALESDGLADGEMTLDMGWDSMYDSGRGASAPAADAEGSWEQTATHEKTLKEHLQQQLGVSTTDDTLRFLGGYLIDAIDDAGYIHVDLDEVAKRFNVSSNKMEEALELIHNFDPSGVGARNLEECLKLQVQQNDDFSKKFKEKTLLVLEHLDLLAHKDIGKLAKLVKCSNEEMMKICEHIQGLTPKPGLMYGSDVSSTVVPDVSVIKDKNGWRAELNAEAMPKILLNHGYDTLSAKAQGEEKSYMNERVSRAQWLVKSLEQRAKTIYKVANAIVTLQNGFFDYGAENLEPMTLKVVAEMVDVHESTVSRVTNGKYMQTPMGVFELKYFFSSAIGTTGGNTTVASESVKQIIKRLINGEDATKPLSDEKLVSLLKQEGVDVARRTVAKYREGLGIPSSSKRRIRL